MPEELVHHPAGAEQAAEVAERHVARRAAREREFAGNGLLADRVHVIAQRLQQLPGGGGGDVAFELANRRAQDARERLRQPRRAVAQFWHLLLECLVGARGLRRVGRRQDQVVGDLVERADDVIDRRAPGAAFEYRMEGAELCLDIGTRRAALRAENLRQRTRRGGLRVGRGAAGRGLGPFAREHGLVADRFEQLFERRGRRRECAQGEIARPVLQELLQAQLLQRLAPGLHEIALIELQHLFGQIVVLARHRRLLAGGAQHPAFALDALGNIAERLDEAALEAVVGEESRHPHAVQAAGGVEHHRHVGPALARRYPIGSDRAGLRFQELIGALCDRKPRQRALAFLDQAAVELDQRFAGVEVEHGGQMLFQPLDRLGVAGSGIERRPILPHPVLDQFLIGGLQAAEHHVDLERLIGESRIGEVGAKLLLQPEDQARPEHALEPDVVDVLGGRLQALALAQPEGAGERRRYRTHAIAGRQIAQVVEQRQNFVQVAIGDDRFSGVGIGGRGIGGAGGFGLLDQGAIVPVAHEPHE